MKNDSLIEPTEKTALRRYSLVTELKNFVDQGLPLAQALDLVALHTQNQPDGPVAIRTLEDWWYAHHKGGFNALKPCNGAGKNVGKESERCRVGCGRRSVEAEIKWIVTTGIF